jgi:DNA-binding NarL/FixJ family response regulator
VATLRLLGRTTERAALLRLLDAVGSAPRALVFEGEAGIGKTALWEDGVHEAERRSLEVLRARPAERERGLSWAGLTDLLGPSFDVVREGLPVPQERALAAALLREESTGHDTTRPIGTAVASALGLLAQRRPVLVAIDDVQWLDPASRDALAFALRRLPTDVAVLLTRRLDETGGPASPEDALPPGALEHVVLGPLSLAALHHLLVERLDIVPSRRDLVRIAETSRGNPLFALELARTLATSADGSPGTPLPVPPSLADALTARIHALSPAGRRAALVAAALSRPSAEAVAAALGDDGIGVADAFDAGVLVRDGERLRFAHPLLASAAYGAAPAAERRRLHRALAAAADDPEERARHVAAATATPSSEAAAVVEAGGRAASERGAPLTAAELLEAACRLTPRADAADLDRRRLDLASAHLAAGDLRVAATVARGADDRPRAELLLADVALAKGDAAAAVVHLSDALAAAGGDATLAAQAEAKLALALALRDPAAARGHAAAAARHVGGAALAPVLFTRVMCDLLLGRPFPRATFARALALEAQSGGRPRSSFPLIWFRCIDDVESARARHALEDAWYRDRGETVWRAERAAQLAEVELRAGDAQLAERLVEESCAEIEHLEPRGPWAMPFRFRAVVDAHAGRTARARETLAPFIEEAAGADQPFWHATLLSTLAEVARAEERHEEVDAIVAAMRARLESVGIIEFWPDRSEPFHVESLVALSRVDDARVVLARLEERGRRLPRIWVDATLPRARAAVLAADGELDAALAALDALDAQTAARLPLEHGLALLARGRILRRAKRRRLAADALAAAREVLERAGARPWAEQAAREEARVGLRRAPGELTPTERTVAELAAAGLTNREVAAAAFMSAKTVEANLARVYRKLGIRSRAELGATMLERAQP